MCNRFRGRASRSCIVAKFLRFGLSATGCKTGAGNADRHDQQDAQSKRHAGRPGSAVTLRTIAEVTGLSLSTVSLSLRGGTTLKQETRDKVAEAAKALGYIPDRAGVRLRTGKTNVIALVLDGAEDSIDFARQMIQGIGQAIKGTRYHLTVIPEFERHNSAETIRYILDNRTADGVIITHTGAARPARADDDRCRFSVRQPRPHRVLYPAPLPRFPFRGVRRHGGGAAGAARAASR